jgi:hypothetical protein
MRTLEAFILTMTLLFSAYVITALPSQAEIKASVLSTFKGASHE